MRVLIVGARSKTVEALLRLLRRELPAAEVLLLSHRYGEPASIYRYPVHVVPGYARQPLKNACLCWEPELILNAAAITDVDACERDRALAWQVNVGLVETLAGVCRMLGAHLVQLSSDYVFEGKQGPYAEQARPNPLNYYGKTKLAAENVCQTAAPSVTIVRTTHIYGTPAPWSSDILRWALSQVRQGMVVPAAVDLYTNPIFVDDLARALLTAIRRRDEGIVHVAGREWLSRYEFLRTAFRVLELPQELLVPMAAAELYRGRAPRPLRAGLLCERAEALWHFHPRSLEEALWVVRYRLQSRESEAGDTSE